MQPIAVLGMNTVMNMRTTAHRMWELFYSLAKYYVTLMATRTSRSLVSKMVIGRGKR